MLMCNLYKDLLTKACGEIKIDVLDTTKSQLQIDGNPDAVIIIGEGEGNHPLKSNPALLEELSRKKINIGVIHYALHFSDAKDYKYLDSTVGGHYEPHWSVNPTWLANFTLERHPITNGVKPFSINEVLARVKAVLRRSGGETSRGDMLDFGELHIDLASETAELAGRPLSLSRKEFDLLALLARHPDTYFSRAVLISSLWKDAPYVLDRTVDVHIARIRSKLGGYRDLIKNKTGFGYYVDSHYVIQK